MEQIKELICPELLVLVPVLYLIGAGLKKTKFIQDNYIPIILGICGIALALIYILPTGTGETFTAITQGVLCAGASVYVNQIIKQGRGDK